MFGEQFPYTNTHDLNLDWIVKMIREMNAKLEEAIQKNIKLANPAQWDITKQYEEFTLVVNENIGYVSTRAVPEGIEITNQDYWLPIFDMESLIDDMGAISDAVTALEQRVTGDEESISGLGDRLTTAEGDISGLDGRMDTAESDINGLESDLSTLDGQVVKNNSVKELLVLGDSYVVWYSNQLYNEIVNKIGIPPAQCHNVAVSGASFSDVNNSYLMQVQNYSGDKSKITDILIVGGINDALLAYDNYLNVYPDTSGLQNAITAFVAYCGSAYPNAKIHTAYVGGCLASSDYYAALHPAKSQEWALWAYTVFAQGKGMNVLEVYDTIHLSPNNYYEDGLHPNTLYGVPALSEAIAAAFNGQKPMTNRPTILVSIDASGITATSYLAAFMKIVNGFAELSIPDQHIVVTADSVIGQTEVEIATLVNTGFILRNPVYIHTQIIVNGFGLSEPTLFPAMVIIRDGKMYLIVYSGDMTATNGSTIKFCGIGEIAVPLWQIN